MTTTPLTDQQLAEIRARADAATPGPWNIARDAGYSEEYGENFVANWTGPYMLGVGDISLGVGQEAEADLAFVLAARTDVPALLAELDRLRAELEQARQQTDVAYRERAQLTAWLAALHPAVIAPAPDVDEPGWQILYMYADGRQLSWHIHPRDAELYTHVKHVSADDPRAQWDGHTTEQKYEAIRAATRPTT